jgi:outer membrane protein assembly factor BamB
MIEKHFPVLEILAVLVAFLAVWRLSLPEEIQQETVPPVSSEASPGTADNDWPCFQGNNARTGAATGALPQPLRLLWSRELGGEIAAPPVVAADTVFCASGGTIQALTLAEGNLAWKCTPSGTFAAPLCYDGGRLFCGNDEGEMLCLSATDGKIIWRLKTDGEIKSGAAAAGGLIVFGSYDNHLYACDRADGKLRWKLKTGAQVHAPVCVNGDFVYSAGCDGFVRKIALADGSQVAAAELPASIATAPTFFNNRIVLGTMQGEVFLLDAGNLDIIWKTAERYQAALLASPAIGDEAALVAWRDGSVRALNLSGGGEKWSFSAKSDSDCAPVTAGDICYHGGEDGKLLALEARTGKPAWRYDCGGKIAGLVPARNRLLAVGGNGSVFCFGR